jgi:hypothetical protein
MKKVFLLYIIILFGYQVLAQDSPAPAPSNNILFLKFSYQLNGGRIAYSNRMTTVASSACCSKLMRKISYTYRKRLPDSTIVSEKFAVTYLDEEVYADPSIYENIALTRTQLATILKDKSPKERRKYFRSFKKIYVIDYEQVNPEQSNQVKIIEVMRM